MYGKKVKLRILFVFLLLVSAILSVFLILKSLEENVVYFLSPTEIKNLSELQKNKIRIGGMVKDQSIIINSEQIIFIILLLLSLILSVFLVLKSLEENVVYFQSPSDIQLLEEIEDKKIRVGGMVKENSIEVSSEKINFIVTDFKNEINVVYSGVIPNLFSERKGVVAEGYLKDRSFFEATKILAKHDENYMPPEVKAILKEK